MANPSGDAPLLDSKDESSSQPAFPNTRWMKLTTDFSRNPGVFDDVFKRIKGTIDTFPLTNTRVLVSFLDMMPPAFEGAKLSVTKMMSSHFQVSHTMTLSGGSNSGYRFGANYVGTQLYSPSEVKIHGGFDP